MNAFIDPAARLGDNVTVGHYSVIEKDVEIGDNTVIGSHVVIHPRTRIGGDVRIDDHTVLGKLPMRSPRSKTTADTRTYDPLLIGDRVVIGTGAVLYAGSIIGDGALIADTASIREDVTVGDLTIIGRNVTIENRVTIGERCKIQTGVYLCTFSEIGDDCFIAPCVATSNDNFAGRWKERTKYYKGVVVKNGGRIGVNATILPGRVVEEDGLVGGGSVVTRDVDAGIIVCGNPARPLRKVPLNQLLKNQED